MNTINHIYVDVPTMEMPFFMTLVRKMGWTVREPHQRRQHDYDYKSALDYVKDLSLSGTKVVPADEDGRNARVEALL